MTYLRTTDHAVIRREVIVRAHGIVQFLESGRANGRRIGPRYDALPEASFDRWARLAVCS